MNETVNLKSLTKGAIKGKGSEPLLFYRAKNHNPDSWLNSASPPNISLAMIIAKGAGRNTGRLTIILYADNNIMDILTLELMKRSFR